MQSYERQLHINYNKYICMPQTYSTLKVGPSNFVSIPTSSRATVTFLPLSNAAKYRLITSCPTSTSYISVRERVGGGEFSNQINSSYSFIPVCPHNLQLHNLRRHTYSVPTLLHSAALHQITSSSSRLMQCLSVSTVRYKNA